MQEVTLKTFDENIAKGFVLVDWSAEWCSPCKQMKPILKDVFAEMKGSVTFLIVDIDKDMELAGKFDISSVPTFILFKDGKEIDRVSGSTTKKSFMKWLNKYLNIKDK